MDTLAKLEKARAALIHSAPFVGALALRLKFELSTECETGDTDGETIRANPTFIDALTMPQVTGFIGHEVFHCAAGHIFRLGGKDRDQWEQACDLEINPMLKEQGLTLPAGALDDAQYHGMAAERIYTALGAKQAKDKQENGQQGAQGAQGQQGGQSGGPSQAGDSQNATGGPQNAPSSDPGRCGAMRKPSNAEGTGPAGQAELSAKAAEWQMNATNAATMAGAAGNLPGGVARMIAEQNRPKVGIADLLSQFIATANPGDYAWSRPNRRYLSQGLFLPSLQPDRLAHVAVVVDDSGSISQDVLGRFGAALNETLGDAQPERLTVICCDRSISKVETFEPGDYPVKLETHGGGGTDFRPPFAYLEELGEPVDCLIYLTDLDAPPSRFPLDPGYPCLWMTTDRTAAPFGDIVRLPS